MRATAWRGGTSDNLHAAYGIRISRQDRDTHFRPHWDTITVRLPNESFTVKMTPSFWRKCTELRSPHIKAYLLREGLIPWQQGKPPAFELILEEGNTFRLDRRHR